MNTPIKQPQNVIPEPSIPLLPLEGLVRLETVLAHYQVSKAQLYQEITEGTFPKQIKIGRSSFWDVKKFRQFLKSQGAEVFVPFQNENQTVQED